MTTYPPAGSAARDLRAYYSDALHGADHLIETLPQLDTRLTRVLVPLVLWHARAVGHEVWLTSTLRQDGVHATGRALDLDFPAADDFGVWIEREVNEHFAGRKADGVRKLRIAYWHANRGSPGYHLHLQVPLRRLWLPAGGGE